MSRFEGFFGVTKEITTWDDVRISCPKKISVLTLGIVGEFEPTEALTNFLKNHTRANPEMVYRLAKKYSVANEAILSVWATAFFGNSVPPLYQWANQFFMDGGIRTTAITSDGNLTPFGRRVLSEILGGRHA